MAGKDLVIESPQGPSLEALFHPREGEKGVVVTHPHPLYGGDMYNNVVEAVTRAYQEMGYSTLRFNFRGVGNSRGRYGGGRGEKEDVKAALGYLSGQGKTRIDLAGYSFGVWVNMLGLKDLVAAQRLVMVSPPVGFMDFSFLGYCSKLSLVITGSEDDIAPRAMLEKMVPRWNPEAIFKTVQGADHFYWGKTTEIEAIIRDFLQGNQAPSPITPGTADI